MKQYGLIGFPLGHSFSKKYFDQKFEQLGLTATHHYCVYELPSIKDFPALWSKHPQLEGVNVTIPHKIEVMSYLDEFDDSVAQINAVNVVRRKGGKLIGYNSDVYGFKASICSWLSAAPSSAIILGSGGSSLAVQSGLRSLGIPYQIVSRGSKKGDLTYDQLNQDPKTLKHSQLLINTTPVGMFPAIEKAPQIPYEWLTADHLCFDLIYNPEETLFMKKAKSAGAKVKNGWEMLKLQAEKSWEIWNS